MSRLLPLVLLSVPMAAFAGPPAPGTLEDAGLAGHDEDGRLLAAPERASGRIINGDAATIDDYPETGMLVFDGVIRFGGNGGPTRVAICSSTLIAPDVVLLAAHCIDPDALTFGFGTVEDEKWYWSRESDLSRFDGSRPNEPLPADAIIAREVLFHPDFDLQSMQIGIAENADIALMFLDEPILDIAPAVLPTVEEADQIAADLEVAIIGWGQQSATGQFEQPPAGSIYIKQQATSHISEVGPFEMKIGELETDARKCHGDSGGPTFLEMEDQDQLVTRRLIGVTSHAYDETDCFETGGVDTRVDAYLDWIDAEMRSRCEDDSRAWCPESPEEQGILAAPFEAKACGCSAAPSSAMSLWGLGLAALIGLRRRK